MRNLLFLIFFLQGCASYVDQMHQNLDHDLGRPQARNHYQRNKMAFYKKNKRSKEAEEPTSSRYAKHLEPETKRNYQPVAKKRYTARDLIDNKNQGSLWTGKGQRNFLFSKNKIIKNGDIIIIQVERALKKEISLELNRAFPKRNVASQNPNARNQPGSQNKKPIQPAKESEQEDSKVQIFDKISSVVVEEVNKDYLLIRGRKDVIFNRAKRMIEVEMLVARKDITEDDTILSSNTFEKTVNILR